MRLDFVYLQNVVCSSVGTVAASVRLLYIHYKRTLAATVPTEEQTTFLTKPKRPPDLPTRSGPSTVAQAQWPFKTYFRHQATMPQVPAPRGNRPPS